MRRLIYVEKGQRNSITFRMMWTNLSATLLSSKCQSLLMSFALDDGSCHCLISRPLRSTWKRLLSIDQSNMIVFRECLYNQLIIRSLCLVVSSSLCISLPFNINNYCSSCLFSPHMILAPHFSFIFISLQFNRLLLLSPLRLHMASDFVTVCVFNQPARSIITAALTPVWRCFSSPASPVCLCGKISQALEESRSKSANFLRLAIEGEWPKAAKARLRTKTMNSFTLTLLGNYRSCKGKRDEISF